MEILFVISLLLILFLIIFCSFKIKYSNTINKVLITLSIILLIWKTLEFGYYHFTHKGIYPVEISHISYFLISIIILLRNKKLYFTGGLFGLLSGLGYFITALITPQNMINLHSPLIVIAGIISHSLLLFMGIFLIFKIQKYEYKNIYIPYLFLFLIIGYVYLCNKGVIFPELSSHNYVSLKIISFQLLTYIGINDLVPNIIATVGAIILTMVSFLFLNYINHKVIDKSKEAVYLD